MNKPQQIPTQESLDTLLNISPDPLDCFILLNYGLRTSKQISYTEDGDYHIYHEVDDTEETIPHDELPNHFIGQAMQAGALYKY